MTKQDVAAGNVTKHNAEPRAHADLAAACHIPPPFRPQGIPPQQPRNNPRRPALRCAPHTALGHFRLPWAGGGWGRLDARRAPRRAHDLGRQRAAYLAANANTNVNANATSPHLPTPPAAPRPCSRGVRRQSADRAAPATTTRLAAPDAPSPPLFNSTPRRRPRDRHAPRPCPMPHAPSLPSRPASPSPHAAIGRSIGPIAPTVASSRAASTAESAPPPSHAPHPHPPPLPAPPEPPPRLVPPSLPERRCWSGWRRRWGTMTSWRRRHRRHHCPLRYHRRGRRLRGREHSQ